MTAKLIDGKALAMTVRAEYRRRVEHLSQVGRVPGLAVILVGGDPAQVYVANKTRAWALSR